MKENKKFYFSRKQRENKNDIEDKNYSDTKNLNSREIMELNISNNQKQNSSKKGLNNSKSKFISNKIYRKMKILKKKKLKKLNPPMAPKNTTQYLTKIRINKIKNINNFMKCNKRSNRMYSNSLSTYENSPIKTPLSNEFNENHSNFSREFDENENDFFLGSSMKSIISSLNKSKSKNLDEDKDFSNLNKFEQNNNERKSYCNRENFSISKEDIKNNDFDFFEYKFNNLDKNERINNIGKEGIQKDFSSFLDDLLPKKIIEY